VYVSGTGGAENDTASGAVSELAAYEETRRALDNVAAILSAAGSSPDRIISAQMLLTCKEDYAECNRAYIDFFAVHGGPELPARSSGMWAVPTMAKVAFSVVAARHDEQQQHSGDGAPGSATAATTAARDVQDMRSEYASSTLDEASCGDDPMALFRAWFEAARAAQLPEPNAMTLSTVAVDTLQPSTRVVLLKGFDERGFQFYTNHTSRKARELAANPRAALTFLWLPLERQVRVEGSVRRLDAEESRQYFHSRPRASQIGAWASHQSAPVASADELRARERELWARFKGGPVPMPDFWGGYALEPAMIEFWQGRTSRLHDRIVFRTLSGGSWTRERLCP